MEATKQLHLMGTTIDLKINHPFPYPILEEIEEDLKDDEKRFSANDSTSELSKINKKAGIEPVVVAPDLYQLIAIGKKESLRENTNLNIAIGPLVQTWRIGFADAKVPKKEEIAEKIRLIQPKNILLDDTVRSVFLKENGMKIDLGALAKGYFADEVKEKLISYGVTSGLINLGGNMVVFGSAVNREDGKWRIGIQDPIKSRGNFREILKIKNKSVVTSGIYERHLEKNGKSYHHILDSKTGYPVETDILSVTIVSDKSLDGEIWTTHLFGKKKEEIEEIMSSHPEIDWFVINNQNETFYSDGFKEKYVI